MTRKTVNVADLIVDVNYTLSQSTCSPDVRQGAINVLEYVLHATGNYRGFRYLTAKEVPADQLPGINYGVDDADYEARFANTDKTRVQYFD